MMPRKRCIIVTLLLFLIIGVFSNSIADELTAELGAYIRDKFKSNDIVFLGEKHRQPPILNSISELIPSLKDAGVSHICLEISSDQQGRVDHYLLSGEGLQEIQIWPQIDCPEYRCILKTIRGLPKNKSIFPVAIDLPEDKFKEEISRDEYMSQEIAKLLKGNTGKKVLVVLGNLHVLKKLDWEDHLISKHKSIREYLTGFHPGIQMFSISQLIGNNPDVCDFTKAFTSLTGAVAFDCSEKFQGWEIGSLTAIAIKETEPCDAFDGVIVY